MAIRSEHVQQVCHVHAPLSMNVATELPHDGRYLRRHETRKEVALNNGCTPIGLRGKIRA
jgi:hypothetical protein